MVEDRNSARHIIDEYAAMVVRTIFQLKMEGYSQQAIISLSYTSRKNGQKFGVLAKLFEKIPEIFPSA